MKYYLRVEAVNLSNFIFDTQDLSTIRGGSLLLLDMVEKLPTKHARLRTVMTGASIGLFSFEAVDDSEAQSFRNEVENDIHRDPDLKHATFVVDVVVIGPGLGFPEIHQRIMAMNRWRQWRQPTVAVPTRNHDQSLKECREDMVRPVLNPAENDGKRSPSSSSVHRRREYGRDTDTRKRKRDFYVKNVRLADPGRFPHDLPNDLEFTHDLNELSDRGGDPLHAKMAVIYADGNGFGSLQAKAQTEEELIRFSARIKRLRANALRKLLESMNKDEGWRNRGRFRIETLLWGGDDLIWVVPAWKGWETLQLFYEEAPNWTFREEGAAQDRRLTHAAGLVFCNHKAPIHRVVALAKELAELAKTKDRAQNLFAYEVLESFDHIGRDLGEYRRERCGYAPPPLTRDARAEELILSGERMRDVIEPFAVIKEEFPRRKLHEILQEAPQSPTAVAPIVAEVERGLSPQVKQQLRALEGCFGATDTRWFHIAALWDYIAVE